jgi:lysophospholipase L1-like esterase
MSDGDNEGWPGYVVDQVFDKANASVPKWKPNLILINAGTNDCIQNRSVAEVGSRMRSLILGVLSMSPRATVVLSSLLVNKQPATETNVLNVNQQYMLLATSLRASGQRVVFADMHAADGPQLADLVDDTHPNDNGYRKMAKIWYRSISQASLAGFLTSPEPVSGVPDEGGT